MSLPCPVCGCSDTRGANTHLVAAALAEDDLDRAIEIGLFSVLPCMGCADACTTRVIAARDMRRSALAARDRYRARQARLARRAAERAAARGAPVIATPEAKPALPSAAAAALARAKARAAERRKP